MASILSDELLKNGVEVMTSLEGRSDLTRKRAQDQKVKIVSKSQMAQRSDLIISAVTPSSCTSAAASIGQEFKGTYVDLNNVSPQELKRSFKHLKKAKVVDAAIIGSVVRWRNQVQILASGEHAEDFARLNEYGLNIKIIGSEIGQASSIKMLRSSYTKGVSALLWETLYAAYKIGVDKELLKVIASTEGPSFKKLALSRITSSAFHASRRAEEMEEVKSFLSQIIDPLMVNCVEESFKEITQNLGKLDKKPVNYKEIFDLWDKEP